jgi:hypothetical protein
VPRNASRAKSERPREKKVKARGLNLLYVVPKVCASAR